MQNKIIQDFTSNTKTTDTEVELFQQLAKSILKFSNGIFVDETHGTTSNVEYTSIRGVIERCEISDLLILTIDKNRSINRATFWQAKKEVKPQWVNNAGKKNITDGCFDFKCQFNQWELLSYRPHLSGVGKFSPPHKLLSSFDSASIGSYGVFHQKNNKIEVNYSIAEFISSSSLPNVNGKKTKAHPRMAINEKMSKYVYGNGERIVCTNLYDFIISLLIGAIGAPLNLEIHEHLWLMSYVKQQAKSSKNVIYGNNTNSLEELLPDISFDDNVNSYASGKFSILVIPTST